MRKLREVVDIDKMCLCQGKGLLILCLFCGNLLKNSEPEISCLLYLLTWKRLFLWCQGKLFVLLCLVDGVMSLYKGCKTVVSVDGELSSYFL